LGFFEAHITGQSLIVFGGGLFLLYKSVSEIHHKMEGEEEGSKGKASNSLVSAIFQIALLNIVFSFDSILTAVGMVSNAAPAQGGFGSEGALIIMILAVIISMIIMMIFAGTCIRIRECTPHDSNLGIVILDINWCDVDC